MEANFRFNNDFKVEISIDPENNLLQRKSIVELTAVKDGRL